MTSTIQSAKLKVGDFFTNTTVKEVKESNVWVYDGYNRSTRKYDAHKFSDVNHSKSFNASTHIVTGFTF